MVSAIEPRQLSELLSGDGELLLLDVRQPEEHAHAAIGSDVLIPLGELPARESELAGWRAKPVVVYCHHGIRSAQAAGFLAGAGYQNVVNLTGGIDRWSVDVDRSVPRY